ncbi:MAG: hypothetical protein WCO06_02895 [Candidatus Roizmanbacteria bacterium]
MFKNFKSALVTTLVIATFIITQFISTGAIVYNAYEIAKSNPNQSLGDSIKQATCNGNKDASIFYCAGNVVGQIATGEVIAISAAKAIGTIGKYAGNTVKSETKALSVVDDIAKAETTTKTTLPESLNTKPLIPKTPEEIAVIKASNQKVFEPLKEQGLFRKTDNSKFFEDLYYHEQETALALMKEGKIVTALKEGNINGTRYVDFQVRESNGTSTITRYIEAKHIESSNPSAINRNILDAQEQILGSAQKNAPTAIEINLNSTDINIETAVSQINNMRKRSFEVTVRKGDTSITLPMLQ